MNDFNKTVRLGAARTYGGRGMSVYCSIKYIDGKLSISGVEGPLPSGNALGSCGQIDMHLKPEDIVTLAPGWTRGKIRQFLSVWRDWHLNDMQAGTPKQTEELKKHEFRDYGACHYTWASDLLTKAGLNPDDGYMYGSAWLTASVPNAALVWLQALPETDKTPAWV